MNNKLGLVVSLYSVSGFTLPYEGVVLFPRREVSKPSQGIKTPTVHLGAQLSTPHRSLDQFLVPGCGLSFVHIKFPLWKPGMIPHHLVV